MKNKHALAAQREEPKPAPLGTEERLALLDAIDALEPVSSADDLIECTDGVIQRILPHQRFVCSLTYVGDASMAPYRLLLNRFPRGYIDSILNDEGSCVSPMVARWRQTRAPVVLDPANDPAPWQPEWLAGLPRWGIDTAISHGLVDAQGVVASYFSFVNVPSPLGEKHCYLMKRLVPHLHVALVRSLATVESLRQETIGAVASVRLTPRQREVLDWLRHGKTNKEIAQVLGTSEDNIKYHLSQIFARLGAANRTQAVSKALLLNIIEP